MKRNIIVLAIIGMIAIIGVIFGYVEMPQSDPFLSGQIIGIGRASIEDPSGRQTDYPALDIKIGDSKFVGIVNSTDNLKEGMIISFIVRKHEMTERINNGEKFFGAALVNIVYIEQDIKLTG